MRPEARSVVGIAMVLICVAGVGFLLTPPDLLI